MNGRRYRSVFAAIGLCCLADFAVAEWRLGAELDLVNSAAELSVASATTDEASASAAGAHRIADNSLDENEPELGVFLQYTRPLGFQFLQGVEVGVHLGYRNGGGEWQSSTAPDRFSAVQNSINRNFRTDGFAIDAENDSVLDLLGIVRFDAWENGGRPFIMGGYSRSEWESETTLSGFIRNRPDTTTMASPVKKDSAALNGYKIALGVEKPAGGNRIIHLLGYYADYGDAKLKFNQAFNGGTQITNTREIKMDADEWGVKIGLGFRF